MIYEKITSKQRAFDLLGCLSRSKRRLDLKYRNATDTQMKKFYLWQIENVNEDIRAIGHQLDELDRLNACNTLSSVKEV